MNDLSDIIDAKLTGLQQFEDAQSLAHNNLNNLTMTNNNNNNNNINNNHENESLFPSSSLASFFCFCSPSSSSLPFPSSIIPESAPMTFYPLLESLSLCVSCGLLQSTEKFNNDLMTGEIQSLIAGIDPSIIAGLPYPLSAMLNTAAYTNMANSANINIDSNNINNDRYDNEQELTQEQSDTDDLLTKGLKSIQLHQTKNLPQLLTTENKSPIKKTTETAQSSQSQLPAITSNESRSPSPLSEISSPTSTTTINSDHVAPSSRSQSPVAAAISANSPNMKNSQISNSIVTTASPSQSSQSNSHPDHSPVTTCSSCIEMSSRVSSLELSERRLLKQLDDSNKKFEDRLKKLERMEEKFRRLDKFEALMKNFPSMEEKLKSLISTDSNRREWERKHEKRLNEEIKKRLDFERWLDDSNVDRDEYKKSLNKKLEIFFNEDKNFKSQKEDEENKLKLELKKFQQKLAENEKEIKNFKEKENHQQKKKIPSEISSINENILLLTNKVNKLEQNNLAQQEKLKLSLEQKSFKEFQSFNQSLINIANKVDSLESSMILNETNLSRTKIIDIIGFDFGDE